MKDVLILDKVDSSVIETISYDGDEKKLWVTFKSGAMYEYLGVDHELVEEFFVAESKGKFFRANIKDKFEYEKLEG